MVGSRVLDALVIVRLSSSLFEQNNGTQMIIVMLARSGLFTSRLQVNWFRFLKNAEGQQLTGENSSDKNSRDIAL